MYKEPFLLPTENLIVGLGDTRKLSVSKGLEGRAATRVSLMPGGQGQGTKGDGGLARGLQVHILNFLNRLSDTHHLQALSQVARGSDWPPLM